MRARDNFVTSRSPYRRPPASFGRVTHEIDSTIHRASQSRARRPQHGWFVAVANVADVIRFVLVDDRVRIREAERPAEPRDIFTSTRQKRPAGPRTMSVCVGLEHGRRVVGRLEWSRSARAMI